MTRKENLIAFLFILPPIVGFCIFTIGAMAFSFVYSFQDYNLFDGTSQWLGLKNYVDLFTHILYSKSFLNAIVNTLVMMLSIPLSMVLGLFLAGLLRMGNIKGSKVFQVLYYLPAVSSAVALNIVWRYIFNNEFGIIMPGEEIAQRIAGVSYQENDNISMQELRYLRVLHMGFDGQTHIGELLVHESIAEDILEIMAALYENQYPIEKMLLVDEYGADDEVSMQENNTSAFNYREIAGTSRLSQHSLGLAIDINPKFNPYVKEKDGELTISPANAEDYVDRTQEFEYKIDENDLCYQLFTAHGFTWGGSWNSVKDYQHFEK